MFRAAEARLVVWAKVVSISLEGMKSVAVVGSAAEGENALASMLVEYEVIILVKEW